MYVCKFYVWMNGCAHVQKCLFGMGCQCLQHASKNAPKLCRTQCAQGGSRLAIYHAIFPTITKLLVSWYMHACTHTHTHTRTHTHTYICTYA